MAKTKMHPMDCKQNRARADFRRMVCVWCGSWVIPTPGSDPETYACMTCGGTEYHFIMDSLHIQLKEFITRINKETVLMMNCMDIEGEESFRLWWTTVPDFGNAQDRVTMLQDRYFYLRQQGADNEQSNSDVR